MSSKKFKICFAASSGGHLEQIMMLKPIMDKYNSFVITEKTSYKTTVSEDGIYQLSQINRRQKTLIFRFIVNSIYSMYIFLKEKPDVVISTGVLSMIPICLIAKLFGKKLIYIESFAKVKSPTEIGRLLYHFADRFYVQWKSMCEIYPNAIYVGGIY